MNCFFYIQDSKADKRNVPSNITASSDWLSLFRFLLFKVNPTLFLKSCVLLHKSLAHCQPQHESRNLSADPRRSLSSLLIRIRSRLLTLIAHATLRIMQFQEASRRQIASRDPSPLIGYGYQKKQAWIVLVTVR